MVKKWLGKVGEAIGGAFKEVMVSIATEVVKKQPRI
jgi:hypothetical protein